MMGEAFARLSPLGPLSSYRYVGFGSEFFNDFALYHETLGIRDMISIEKDVVRVPRCEFNRPYKCIRVESGTASEVLPKLSWERRSIVWLDYVSRLDHAIVSDVELVVAAAASGSLLIWTVNANPWDAEGCNDAVGLPQQRISRLRKDLSPTLVPDEWVKNPLSKWGLAEVYWKLITASVEKSLSARNASLKASDRLTFKQCFHFRYKDGQRMLTVGGLLLNPADSRSLGESPFDGLSFTRKDGDAMEIKPPILTGREVRYLNRLCPQDNEKTEAPEWLTPEEVESFRQVYRYYPVYAESELKRATRRSGLASRAPIDHARMSGTDAVFAVGVELRFSRRTWPFANR